MYAEFDGCYGCYLQVSKDFLLARESTRPPRILGGVNIWLVGFGTLFIALITCTNICLPINRLLAEFQQVDILENQVKLPNIVKR